MKSAIEIKSWKVAVVIKRENKRRNGRKILLVSVETFELFNSLDPLCDAP